IMILYTDGIIEARNSKGDEFGYDRLSDVLVAHQNKSSDEIQKEVIQALYAFSGSDQLNDDHTMLVVKFK
ncbi:MAG: PP2C family protein-serine/threonine phosphatase, partial [Cyclobacteriaceae bacterium]